MAYDNIEFLNQIRHVGEIDEDNKKKHLVKVGAGVSN